MRGLVVRVYFDFGSVSLAVHSYFVEADECSNSEAVGEAAVADSAVVAALVGSELLVGSAEEVCFPSSCCLGNPSPCDP